MIMDSRISQLDVDRAKARLSELQRKFNAQKRTMNRPPISKEKAGKAWNVLEDYGKQQVKSVAKKTKIKAKKVATSGAKKAKFATKKGVNGLFGFFK
jgi:hypothetical protein